MDETTATEIIEEQPAALPGEVCGTDELRAALLEANIKLALLLAGAAKEKLPDAAKLAEGLCAAGAAPAEAASEVMLGYPHLRAVRRELPQLAAQSGGKDDGFALIRSIFSAR